MKKKSWVLFLNFFLIISQFIDIQAQNIKKNISFDWTDPVVFQISDDETIRLLCFHGAISSPKYETLPLFFERFETDAYYEQYRVSLSDVQYRRMTNEEAELVPAGFDERDFSAEAHAVVDRKKNYAALSILPIRKVGNGYEKLLSASVSLEPIRSSAKAMKSHTYANNSVLANGSWYRVSVTKTGVHKVTGTDLTSMGMSVSGLASNRIAIFGNGGTMLSEANGVFRYDDLQELPIEMHDGGDGISGAPVVFNYLGLDIGSGSVRGGVYVGDEAYGWDFLIYIGRYGCHYIAVVVQRHVHIKGLKLFLEL